MWEHTDEDEQSNWMQQTFFLGDCLKYILFRECKLMNE